MSRIRFYYSPIKNKTIEIIGPEAHHLTGVRRLKPGTIVELFDGDGTLAQAEIIIASPRKVTVKTLEIQHISPSTNTRIIIAASIAKGERFDWLVSKCTELGADQIFPVIYHRTVKQLSNPKIAERYQNLAISAAKQCNRLFLPQIEPPAHLSDVIENIKKTGETQLLTGSLNDKAQTLIKYDWPANKNIAAFVGPEGGFTEQEETLLREQGSREIRLTSNILRTETAAIAFATILDAQRQQANLP